MSGKRKKHSPRERAATAAEAVLVLEILRAMIDLFRAMIDLMRK